GRYGWLVVALAWLATGLSKIESTGLAKSQPAAEVQKGQDEQTALDKYVAAPDPNYSFKLVNSVPGKDQTTYILEMTSQAWLTTNEVNRPLWKHWLVIVKPEIVSSSKAFLFITGGANGSKPPALAETNMIHNALTTKSIVSELRMVPNQPL